MKKLITISHLLLIIYFGIPLQAQINTKVNLSFEDNIRGRTGLLYKI